MEIILPIVKDNGNLLFEVTPETERIMVHTSRDGIKIDTDKNGLYQDIIPQIKENGNIVIEFTPEQFIEFQYTSEYLIKRRNAIHRFIQRKIAETHNQ
ncbi:Hypothetical protein HVR_LOCUS436 [uncultured virus]|nr:Hypothetical protein HVR_LOCUS436 [uncultured virus]